MKENELISIVVAIYNVEEYLEKCISSLINQSYSNIEIILVNDGSTDKCSTICTTFKENDNRIIYINKKNGGLSDARNCGIENSKGKYIVFIDGDDYVEPNMIKVLYCNIIKHNADISVCGFNIVDENGNILANRSKSIIENGVYNWEEYYNKIALKDNGWNYVVAWNKMYKKELCDNVQYPVGKIHEDEFVIHKIIYEANKIVTVEDRLYNYVQRSNSIMQTRLSDKNIDRLEALIDRIKFYNEIQYMNTMENSINGFIIYYSQLCNSGFKNELNKREISKKYKKIYFAIKQDKRNYNKIDLKNKIVYEAFRIAPNLFSKSIFWYKNMVRVYRIGK